MATEETIVQPDETTQEQEETKEVEAKEVATVQKTAPAPILFNNDGTIAIKDNNDAFRVASMMIQAQMVPRGYDTPYKVIAGFQAGAELGLPPLSALTSLAMINGTPALHTDGPMSLVLSHGTVEEFEEYFFDKKGERLTAITARLHEPFGAYCRAKRRGIAGFKDYAYTVNDAKDAGLFVEESQRSPDRQRKNKPWDRYTDIMLQRRARSFVLKSLWADVLKGVKIAEYDFHSMAPQSNSNEPVKRTDIMAEIKKM